MSITLADIPTILRFIPSSDRDTWLKVGNGLKTEFGDAAFDSWNDWSQQADSYSAKDARDVWRSLNVGKNSLGTVIYLAKHGGWKPEKRELTLAQKKAFKAEQEARRAERQAQVEAETAKNEAMQKAVAKACVKVWENYGIEFGESAYLKTKQVTGLGVRYFHQPVLMWIDDKEEKAGVISGSKIKAFFNKLPEPRPENISFLRFAKGTIVVPLRDSKGNIHSLQTINATGTKLFPKYSRKAGLYHVIGYLKDAKSVAIAEGYATAASIHMATDWPVVVAFDAGNLPAVAQAVRELCPEAKILICADLDENGKGQTKAQEAADLIGAVVVLPNFGGQQ